MTHRFKKVALVGMASSSRRLAPFGNPDYEMWGLNELHCKGLPGPWARWFELHGRDRIENNPRTANHLHWLKTRKFPIYMQRAYQDIPGSVEYPLHDVSLLFGMYFTSTPAFMMALAIVVGFERIELYGMDMVLESEYFHQRSCMEYLIGWARGDGIQVQIPASSELLRASYLEGYEEEPPVPTGGGRLRQGIAGLEEYRTELLSELERVGAKIKGEVGALALEPTGA